MASGSLRPRLISTGSFILGQVLLTAGTSTEIKPQTDQRDRQPVNQLRQILRKVTPAENQVDARDDLARQKADAAVKLLRLGQASAVWPLLRSSSDPTLRTYLIHALGAADVDPIVIISRLGTEPNVSARRALILSLGGFTAEQLPEAQRRGLVVMLLRWYRDDPDPGVHAAIDWLLRYGRTGEVPRKLDWEQEQWLTSIDQDLAGRPRTKRDWYLTKEGQLMVSVRGPVEFSMGSPAYEAGREPASDSPDESLHRARIPRSFAIAAKEVTIGQFQRFLEANPQVKAKFAYDNDPNRMATVLRTFSPDRDGPQIAVTWYEAAMYCNWLSKQEGLPESEWVYPASFDQIKDGMMLANNYLHRTGYRLPTEAEWEFAARARTTTARFFGNSARLLEQYAWYSKNPPKRKNAPVDPTDPQRTWPVGQLKPNDFGLFDIYGNVWEWCQDRMQPYPLTRDVYSDIEDSILLVSDKVARSRRGGSFPYEAAMQRSAERGTKNALPILRRDNVGFRVARTVR
jgi:formylglycine-generating enzyme required for sulfatase activity